ncbi:MAG TPA: hypothetical protein VNA69_22340 [Thermoanaerobaculia bacterium]|nr:hypothetical protein [Thermoanaerobaculia bacterium]
MIRRELTILVGDANGADKAIQTYFAEQHYANVLVFCTAGDCRNNVGDWPIRAVDAPYRVRDFAFFTAKDAAMADEADVGLALSDGQSSGTIVNVARLVTRAKPAVVYIAPAKTFSSGKGGLTLSGAFLSDAYLLTRWNQLRQPGSTCYVSRAVFPRRRSVRIETEHRSRGRV